MYDYGDSWESKFLLLTGEFGLPFLGCGLLILVIGIILGFGLGWYIIGNVS